MNTTQQVNEQLTVEEASRLAVTATVADLEDWARSTAARGQVDLSDLLEVLDLMRVDSAPSDMHAGQASCTVPALPVVGGLAVGGANASLDMLHDDYAECVNLAIAEGRDDLVRSLVAEFDAVSAQTLGGVECSSTCSDAA